MIKSLLGYQDLERAESLELISKYANTQPLDPGDCAYTDVSAGRSDRSVDRTYNILTKAAHADADYATVTIAGHTGAGKSTELLQLKRRLEQSGKFVCVSFQVDPETISKYGHTAIFLWLVTSVAHELRLRYQLEFDESLLDGVSHWYADVVKVKAHEVVKELSGAVTGTVEAKHGVWGVHACIKATLALVGKDTRKDQEEVRLAMQRSAGQLVGAVNVFLDETRDLLTKIDKPDRLAIIVDELDKLEPVPAKELLFGGAKWLNSIHADIVFTVPVAIVLEGSDIRRVFPDNYRLPMIKTTHRDSTPFTPGIDAIRKLVERRVDPSLFTDADVIAYLIRLAGGDIRDLMRLIREAAFEADDRSLTRIDMACAVSAVAETRKQMQQGLDAAFPLLANVDRFGTTPELLFNESENVDKMRVDLAEFIKQGRVLVYEDDAGHWYVVHPIIKEMDGFERTRRALFDHVDKPQQSS